MHFVTICYKKYQASKCHKVKHEIMFIHISNIILCMLQVYSLVLKICALNYSELIQYHDWPSKTGCLRGGN